MCKIYVNALFGWLFQVHRRHVVKRLHFPQQLLLSNPLHINRTLHDCMCVGKAKIYASILQASQNQKNNAGNCKSNSHWLCSVASPGRKFKGREKTCALTEILPLLYSFWYIITEQEQRQFQRRWTSDRFFWYCSSTVQCKLQTQAKKRLWKAHDFLPQR